MSYRNHVDDFDLLQYLAYCPFVCNGFAEAGHSGTGISMKKHSSDVALADDTRFPRSRFKQVFYRNGRCDCEQRLSS